MIGHLPEPINDLVRAYYLTARRKQELVQARWEWVDRGARTLTIPDTKNGDPAVIPLEGELAELLERRWRAREVRRKDGTVFLSPWIFHRQGKPVRKFTRAFDKARIAAGVPHKTVHDFRRTALRDFIRAGVHQHVAMQMSGHRSASVFRRYDIVDVEDVR
jgi:integrase